MTEVPVADEAKIITRRTGRRRLLIGLSASLVLVIFVVLLPLLRLVPLRTILNRQIVGPDPNQSVRKVARQLSESAGFPVIIEAEPWCSRGRSKGPQREGRLIDVASSYGYEYYKYILVTREAIYLVDIWYLRDRTCVDPAIADMTWLELIAWYWSSVWRRV